jgi:hypothetical protein
MAAGRVALLVLIACAILPGRAVVSAQSTAEIHLRVAANRLTLEQRQDGGDSHRPVPTASLVLDGSMLPRASDMRTQRQSRGWTGFEIVLGSDLASGPHSLHLSGLEAMIGTPVALTVVSVGDIRVAAFSPWTSENRSKGLLDGERMHLYFATLGAPAIDLRLESVRAQSGLPALLARAGGFAVPLATTFFILACTTWIQRWFQVRAAELEAVKGLQVRLARIKVNNDIDTRKRLLDFIEELQITEPYAGFGSRFTAPLDAIVDKGNVDNLPFYEAEIAKLRPDVRAAWVFFIRASAGVSAKP